MAQNKPGTVGLERAESAAARIEEWRSHLLKLSAGSIPDIPELGFLGREMRAAAAVAAMAELEGLLRDMLVAIGDHVTSSRVEIRNLIPPLRALVAHTRFESIASSADADKIWTQRLWLTRLESSGDFAEMPKRSIKSPQPPLDGRTIQSRHLSLVWQVLGLTDPVPAATVVASLKKLTQIRNDVAHRNADIRQVFSEAGRTALDVAKYLDDLVLLVLHIGHEWSAYLDGQSYLANATHSSSAVPP